MAIYSGFFPLKMVIFHSYVSSPEGRARFQTPNTATYATKGPLVVRVPVLSKQATRTCETTKHSAVRLECVHLGDTCPAKRL